MAKRQSVRGRSQSIRSENRNSILISSLSVLVQEGTTHMMITLLLIIENQRCLSSIQGIGQVTSLKRTLILRVWVSLSVPQVDMRLTGTSHIRTTDRALVVLLVNSNWVRQQRFTRQIHTMNHVRTVWVLCSRWTIHTIVATVQMPWQSLSRDEIAAVTSSDHKWRTNSGMEWIMLGLVQASTWVPLISARCNQTCQSLRISKSKWLTFNTNRCGTVRALFTWAQKPIQEMISNL